MIIHYCLMSNGEQLPDWTLVSAGMIIGVGAYIILSAAIDWIRG